MRPTFVEIDLEAIAYNLHQIQKMISPSTYVVAIVKANAYGHGAAQVSAAALAAGAHFLGVALPEEGADLRAKGVKAPIFVLGLALGEQARLFLDYDLIATISTSDMAKVLAEEAKRFHRRGQVMVKIDTGMGRIGIRPDQALPFIKEIIAIPDLELKGVFTHLANADSVDKTYARYQINLFQETVNRILTAGIKLCWISAANSAAILELKEAHYNLVRPGIILYGLPPSSTVNLPRHFIPAMQFKTKVVFIKEVPAGTPIGYGGSYVTPHKTFIATLPVGYADGYSRHLSNKAHVLIGGLRRKVVGRVCMDQIMVDVGPNGDVHIGDEAILFGRQGNEEITVTELADLAGTINYELVCAISSRVPRIYLNEQAFPVNDHRDHPSLNKIYS